MAIVAAVSGGVDSVVMLHMLTQKQEDDIVVAHFDHGIRPESDADARFVEGLARQYGLRFELRREELGASASEELARTRRYAFLRELAKKYDANIATAHHADDVVETIAINLQRGTGWRGLAVLDTRGIERPLLSLTKQLIYDYAVRYNLEWVEDETNASDYYLRNRLRRRIQTGLSPHERKQLIDLYRLQIAIKQVITKETISLLPHSKTYSRYFFTHCGDKVACELLRTTTQAKATRPQYERALHAIKTAATHTRFELAAGVYLQFTAREFIVEIPQ